ncbi:MAG: hypothetical protein IKH38_06635 [Clostridia bacterium]|nr:hypothetical protein [Clostridia bacterium]
MEDQVRCLYCRNLHWRPDKEPDDQSRRLLQRADSCCEELRFDDAQGLYRRVLENDKTNADALWGVIRCAYHVQILYEDGTKKTVAVCLKRVARDIEKLPEYHKLRETPEYPKRFASFVENVRQQQETLNKLWRSLADSDENLYDVYICYKETERFADGHTAPSADRGLVRNLYRQLTSQIERDGKRIRIFYAPESLRNLSGAPYSAGITHALSTSRVMLLIASKPEYLQTTWVRSERERFRELMQEDGVDRALLPLVDPSQPQSAYAGDPGIQYITIQHSRDAVNPGSVQEILRRIESVLARDDRSDPYRRTTERRLREIQIQQEQEKRERELQRVREEAERRAREEARQEADRRARAEEERRAQEERERQIREETERRIQQEADRRVRAETDRIAREEAARKAREDSDRRAREEASRRAREEADRQARAEAERRAKEEDERRIQEEIDRRVRAVFEQRDREEARRKADEEARQLAEEEAREEEARRRAEDEARRRSREEADRITREEADRKARENAERIAREEAERKAREEADRKAREEAERKAREEAEQKAREENKGKSRVLSEQAAEQEQLPRPNPNSQAARELKRYHKSLLRHERARCLLVLLAVTVVFAVAAHFLLKYAEPVKQFFAKPSAQPEIVRTVLSDTDGTGQWLTNQAANAGLDVFNALGYSRTVRSGVYFAATVLAIFLLCLLVKLIILIFTRASADPYEADKQRRRAHKIGVIVTIALVLAGAILYVTVLHPSLLG